MLLVVILLDTTNLGAVTFPVEPGVRTMFPEPLFAWISTLLFAPNAPIVTAFPYTPRPAEEDRPTQFEI